MIINKEDIIKLLRSDAKIDKEELAFQIKTFFKHKNFYKKPKWEPSIPTKSDVVCEEEEDIVEIAKKIFLT